MEDKEFNYTYTAPTERERKEIQGIRRQYLAEEQQESALEKLRRLDGKVKNPATCIALLLGVVGTLIFGLGMAMVLEWGVIVGGVIASAAGLVPVIFAYPAYSWILQRNKKKIRRRNLTADG